MAKTRTPPMPASVKAVFATYPKSASARLLDIREVIFNLADETNTGPLTETLKWSDPAYLTEKTKCGSTIRLGWKPASADQIHLYFNCKTDLVDRFRSQFPGKFQFQGDRCLSLGILDPVPEEPLRICLQMALTYHSDRKLSA